MPSGDRRQRPHPDLGTETQLGMTQAPETKFPTRKALEDGRRKSPTSAGSHLQNKLRAQGKNLEHYVLFTIHVKTIFKNRIPVNHQMLRCFGAKFWLKLGAVKPYTVPIPCRCYTVVLCV